MDIFINEKPADISLDTEKTLGDVLYGIEQWISTSGSRIKALSVDGENIPEDELAGFFGREVKDINKLDLSVSSWRELAAEALVELKEICILYGNAAFDERGKIISLWENSAAANFTASEIGDLYDFARLCFTGEGLSTQELAVCIEERLREILDSCGELDRTEVLVKSIAKRLEELPLDMQTGKDARAAETMQLFSKTGEKLFRLFFIHVSEGLSQDELIIDGISGRTFLEQFNATLHELSNAYENRDSVLAGDISEYELAPRILSLYKALKDITKSSFAVVSLS